jgi:hypothetical protein
MKLVKRGDTIVAIIERQWEKTYLISQQGKQEWVPLFLVGSQNPIAEIDPQTRLVRMDPGQALADEQEVVFA